MSTARTGPRGTLALAGLIVAVSMTTIDQTIVALSGPTIESDLGLTHDAMQWAVNIYLIATAAFFLLGGRLADVFGHKRMALIGIAGFGLTSLLCSLAPTGDLAGAWLIGARALQGIAGAIMFPAAIGLVVQGFSREGRAKAMAHLLRHHRRGDRAVLPEGAGVGDLHRRRRWLPDANDRGLSPATVSPWSTPALLLS